ncbi:hypothetical protein BLNAU_19724 [Blattamonas nauphoetae]|uniref:Uncharacterized protein n=1 Tax=Blattamonas nauphoetae TaxID=2049346 RepID=A0ABQ9X0P6_9EUKA|nr:hypothetical protein BLNAU_19724 [Blattamonas nauphoetae]
MDDRGKMMNMTVSGVDEFCIFERGFWTSQHISFVKDAEELEVSSVIGSDAVIEFHNLIFAIESGMELPVALFEVEDGTLSLTQTIISVKGDEETDPVASSPTVILKHVSLMLFDFSASVEGKEVQFIDCHQTE